MRVAEVTLAASSAAEDEPKLKTLRERILQRNSDEAFIDYQRVNDAIIRNRLAVGLNDRETPTKAAAGAGP